MLGAEKRRNADAGLVEDPRRRTKLSVDACRVREQTDITAGDQAKRVRVTVGDTVQPGPNLGQ